ncbi:Rpp14/Pop5 family protein [Halosegnis longus]|uniref:Ribonuclease P protein component 2 n=1 Tax=Halosegnis longus TaxID=2216012 RepID=A0AAJ4R9B7_9EURY|nr:Rpp14/Pop5 family protein [Halosegnis longus]RNJ26610.1 ribonuclease P [Salella cibi]
MKHLPKHLRQRWRYLAVAVESWPDADLSRGAFQRDLWYAAQNLLGDTGSADADLTVYGFEFEDGRGHAVVRVRRGEVERARAALACVTEIDGNPVGVRVTGVSGTVRACEERYIQRPQVHRTTRQVALDGVDRRAVVRPPRVDARVGDGHVGATDLDCE